MKAILISAAIVLTLAGHAQASNILQGFWGPGDVDAGVVCVIADVTVLAASEEDCVKIGGEATHSLQRTTTPIEAD